MLLALLLWLVPAAWCAAAAGAVDPQWIMRQVSERERHLSSSAEVEMVLVDQGGAERSRRMRMFSRRTGNETRRAIFFLAPADIERSAYLGVDPGEPGREREQWLYLPALGKSKRIASGESSQSFMGSDLSYADLVRRDSEEFNYTLLREDRVDEQPVWLVEARPVSEEIMRRVGFSKSLLVVRQDNFVVIRAINWLLAGNRLRYLEVRRIEEIDGIWAPSEVHVWTSDGRQTLHKTIFRSRDMRFNQELPPDLFSLQRLEQGL
ncbi:MAG: hypothetical protein BWK76_15890 [Desulfobulbaceae bacterium A2]|nr:MAG: hypothetical protein BWK76_15890 [Desulfobulbaceae bacterium A2]